MQSGSTAEALRGRQPTLLLRIVALHAATNRQSRARWQRGADLMLWESAFDVTARLVPGQREEDWF